MYWYLISCTSEVDTIECLELVHTSDELNKYRYLLSSPKKQHITSKCNTDPASITIIFRILYLYCRSCGMQNVEYGKSKHGSEGQTAAKTLSEYLLRRAWTGKDNKQYHTLRATLTINSMCHYICLPVLFHTWFRRCLSYPTVAKFRRCINSYIV